MATSYNLSHGLFLDTFVFASIAQCDLAFARRTWSTVRLQRLRYSKARHRILVDGFAS